MNDVIETTKINGYTVELVHDMDCPSPRDNDGNFLFLTFPSREWIKADEEFNPESDFDCRWCEGSGTRPGGDLYNVDDECGVCEGNGYVEASNIGELRMFVAQKYGAQVVLPVNREDHGANVRYYINDWSDDDHWERNNICGLILDTPEALEARMGPDFVATPEWLKEAMTAEIEEYSRWANGECYGFVIKDRNGEMVESCFGFIGYEYAEEEAKAMVPDEPQPPVLYDVRLTKAEIDSIIDRLGNQHEAHHLPVIDKLAAIDTSEEDDDE